MSLKDKILESIKFAREELGFTLVSEDWGSANHKCACALGCVLLKDDPKDTVRVEANENSKDVAKILGVNDEWIDSFISGFDSNGAASDASIPGAWQMGNEIAKETNPIAYHKWDGNPQ